MRRRIEQTKRKNIAVWAAGDRAAGALKINHTQTICDFKNVRECHDQCSCF